MVAYILSTTPLNGASTAQQKLKKGHKLKSTWTLLFFYSPKWAKMSFKQVWLCTMVNIGSSFSSSNYLNYSIELVSHNSWVTLNPTKTTVSVDNLLLLECNMSKNEFKESEDFVTLYNGQYWEPILGICLFNIYITIILLIQVLKRSGVDRHIMLCYWCLTMTSSFSNIFNIF